VTALIAVPADHAVAVAHGSQALRTVALMMLLLLMVVQAGLTFVQLSMLQQQQQLGAVHRK
jgi:hypothetical protein